MCVSRIILRMILLAFLWVVGLRPVAVGQLKVTRPNIIVFLVDDMGWQDTSVPFWDSITAKNKYFHTPNMERLAKEGMKFTSAYATPNCTPCRVSLMTGMAAAHDRVTSYTTPGLKDKTTDRPDSLFREVPWNINGLSPYPEIPHTVYATPLPAVLRDAGYYTIQVGKGHFGPRGTPGSDPKNLGFDVSIAGHAAGSPQSYLGTDNYGNITGHTKVQAVPDLEEYYGSHTFLTEALTKEALKALYAPVRYHQPFFLYMAHYAVHTPLMADERFYQKYIDKGLSQRQAKYASMIEGMDKSLGDIMGYLKIHHLDKNTIIIFMSDNGGVSRNYPLRSGKSSVYEGGIRVPLIVKWPGVTKPGSVARQYMIVQDLFPTILSMAAVKKYRVIQQTDGKSIIPILKNAQYTDTSRILVWHFPNKANRHGPGINYASAIRQGSWKLIYMMKQQELKLYNLKKDIGEHHDLLKQYPEKAKELAGLLTEKLKKWHAQMPQYKKTGKPVPWPDQLMKQSSKN